jgi:protein-disulfide isomerase
MQQRARTVGRYQRKKSYGLPLWGALSVVVLIAGLGFAASTFLLSDAPGYDDWLVGEETHTRGSSSAPVSVVFFGDFQCVECATFAREIQPLLQADFIGDKVVRLAYRHVPTIGRDSGRAAEASECAADQGKFWEYQELVYRWQGAPNSERLSHELLRQLGLGIRLDPSDFRTCMQHGFTAGQVMDDLRFAETLGVSEAPALYVNSVRIDDPTDYGQLRLHIIGAAVAQ